MSVKHPVLDVSVEKTQEFFFTAMAAGFAAGVEPQHNQPLPGWEMMEYRKNSFHLVDMWLYNPYTYNSTGTTTILWNEIPIWVMHYGGWYHESAIETLREALKSAYETKRFRSGRGPGVFETEYYRYINSFTKNDFTSFFGTEKIVTISGNQLLGTHWYRGEWMLNH